MFVQSFPILGAKGRMDNEREQQGKTRSALSTRAAEIATALVVLALGCLVIYDSIRVGHGWGADGPQAGFYPFYVGMALCAAALGILLQQLFTHAKNEQFVGAGAFGHVLALLLPSICYVVAIYFLGIYVSSALFLYLFMVREGKYSLLNALPVSLGVPLALFLVFEIWFNVALPKGPLEAMFGY
jgi:putative tricarboxylic transport membrane protein